MREWFALVALVTLFSVTMLLMGAAMAADKKVCRDAKTGAFVSAAYAKKYPGLTVCETKTDVVKQKRQG